MDEFFRIIGMTTVTVVVIFVVMLLLGISYVGLNNLRELCRSIRDGRHTVDCVANRDFKYVGEAPPSMAEVRGACQKAAWCMSLATLSMERERKNREAQNITEDIKKSK